MLTGILLGLCAATAQSLSYLFLRVFVVRFRGSTLPLLVMSHLIMGALSMAMLPFIWPASMPPAGQLLPPLLGASLYYMAAQAFLFVALRHTDASRVSPLLGLKIVILTGLSMLMLHQHYSLIQWTAVLLCLASAMILNGSGGGLGLKTIGVILLVCTGYSLSDINIKQLIDCFAYLDLLHSSLLSVCLSYVVCGAVSVMALVWIRPSSRVMWMQTVPFALMWFVAMLFLFACFQIIGVVYGNIVQSTRGLISICLGSLISAAGFVHLERKITRGVLYRRAAAALIMLLAIALFYAGTILKRVVQAREQTSNQAGISFHVQSFVQTGADRLIANPALPKSESEARPCTPAM